ncbi:bifunctional Delta(1)-pyrroline-2-carboxylate/Delta(1)-piperideine-2-carboxylate reductase [Chromobacterium rhizoryzae]|uniref:bifunctional Delta(1)-pyrroline-2-carboxylate/Delta(1)-piperideine-2- carboxylate reductase n=1 Tax=Chromobacterium rhizoryzae TaxID=1778675 RepID=UPI001D0795D3|nr:bifunctional Delta(1)-pyrroline-2-carboxylate/Delta(1)-piperideine-2-carboxylate reductase [Chromobacterium rhizoryzae]
MSIPVLPASATKSLLPIADLCQALSLAAAEYTAGRIVSPERQVLPLRGDAVLLSMPASASDIGIHKLVNVCPDNLKQGLPTIHGIVSVYDALTGQPLLILDGPTVTAQRTAAISMLAINSLYAGRPAAIALIGTGKQASGHLEAIAALFPDIRVDVHGREMADSAEFCRRHAPLPLALRPCRGRVADDVGVVITLTTSKAPIYHEDARSNRLLVGVGAFRPDMAEIGPAAIAGSQLFSDDPVGARHEAGDLIQAGVDWDTVQSLAEAIAGRYDAKRPRLFKSVGTAAWDLAAARCALAHWKAG